MDDEAVIKAAQAFVDEGASWVTLRTTEFYGLNRLCALAKKVRGAVPGDYGLVVNTGEFGPAEARAMPASGIDVVYHSLRLWGRSGDMLPPEDRKATLRRCGIPISSWRIWWNPWGRSTRMRRSRMCSWRPYPTARP